jgi:CheY-like chemotaxis protein
MSEEALKGIFQRFEQADNSTTRQYGGTGLGTNIALSLAKLMMGNITAKSQLGIGSQFTITLPLPPVKNSHNSQKPSEITSSQQDELQTPQLSGVKVLLAEDNAINRLIFNKLMSPTAAKVSIATNGEECIELFNKKQPDIIFMDIQMPVMDGISACELIKQQSNIPIIALTANVMREDILSYEKVGFDGILSKPIELEKLYRLCADFTSEKKVS